MAGTWSNWQNDVLPVVMLGFFGGVVAVLIDSGGFGVALLCAFVECFGFFLKFLMIAAFLFVLGP